MFTRTLRLIVLLLMVQLYSCKEEIDVTSYDFSQSVSFERPEMNLHDANSGTLLIQRDIKFKQDILSRFELISGDGYIELPNEEKIQPGKTFVSNSDINFIYHPSTPGLHKLKFSSNNTKITKTTQFEIKVIEQKGEINAFVNLNNITTPIGQPAEIILTVSEKYYTGNFDLKYELLEGGGVFKVNDKTLGSGLTEIISKKETKLMFNPSKGGISKIKLTISDAKGQSENIDLLINTQNEIIAVLDQGSKSAKVGALCNFQLTLSEENYQGVFNVKYKMLSGKGIFSCEENQILSAGRHDIGFTPTEAGTSTFSLTISDTNGNETVVNVTVRASLVPIETTLNKNLIVTTLGETPEELTLTVNESDYHDSFTIQYFVSGAHGCLLIDKKEIQAGLITSIRNGETKLAFIPSQIGTSTIEITIFDKNKQKTSIILTVKTRATITTIAGEGGSIDGDGKYDLNTTATLVATPKEGYTFNGWYEGETKISTERTFRFAVTKSRKIEAIFNKHIIIDLIKADAKYSHAMLEAMTTTFISNFPTLSDITVKVRINNSVERDLLLKAGVTNYNVTIECPLVGYIATFITTAEIISLSKTTDVNNIFYHIGKSYSTTFQ